MKRGLFTILAALSLALCSASTWFFIRSLGGDQYVKYASSHTEEANTVYEMWGARSNEGAAHIEYSRSKMVSSDWQDFFANAPPALGLQIFRMFRMNPRPRRFAVIGCWNLTSNAETSLVELKRELVIPTWFIPLCTAFLPLLWLRGFIRRLNRPRSGFCRMCGYDLSATPNRCPECGKIASELSM